MSVWVVRTWSYDWLTNTTDVYLKSDPDGDGTFSVTIKGDISASAVDRPAVIELVALPTDRTVNRWRILDG